SVGGHRLDLITYLNCQLHVQLNFGDATPQFLRQPDAALPVLRQRRYPQPSSIRPNGSVSRARSFARASPVVSASALTTFKIIAIWRGSLQDTSLPGAGVNCPQFKDRRGGKSSQRSGWSPGQKLWNCPFYSPRFIMYFNKSATRWL